MGTKFKAFIGLGNPGKDYQQTYHNAGSMFIAFLADFLGSGKIKKTVKKEFSYRKAGNVFLVQSEKFMNKSGEVVLAALKYLKLEPEEILIVHDDSDLNLGKWKISEKGGAAGHKGVSSVINVLKTNKIARLRIGIRPNNEARRKKAGEFVLKKIGPTEITVLEKTFGDIAQQLFEKRF
jgi:PTH1 family peptidyl-tRNA hydrolase